MRLGNPNGYCSVCFAAKPEVPYVDCEADYDGAPVLDPETRTIAVIPWTGDLGGHDQLGICATCIMEMAELIAFKPERYARQLKAVREADLRADHWERTARRLQRELNEQFESAFGSNRRRKAAA